MIRKAYSNLGNSNSSPKIVTELSRLKVYISVLALESPPLSILFRFSLHFFSFRSFFPLFPFFFLSFFLSSPVFYLTISFPVTQGHIHKPRELYICYCIRQTGVSLPIIKQSPQRKNSFSATHQF